jgi:four helix bundle protein
VRQNVVREKSYGFALGAIALNRRLVVGRENVLGRQMLRAATSVGANIEEASAAQSRRDFLTKMSIASKEAREAHYWLRLIRDSGTLGDESVDGRIDECVQIMRILTSIVKSTAEG